MVFEIFFYTDIRIHWKIAKKSNDVRSTLHYNKVCKLNMITIIKLYNSGLGMYSPHKVIKQNKIKRGFFQLQSFFSIQKICIKSEKNMQYIATEVKQIMGTNILVRIFFPVIKKANSKY